MSSHLLVDDVKFRRLSIDCPSAMNEWLCRYVWVRQETQQLHGLRLSHLQEVVTRGRVATNLLSFLCGLLGPIGSLVWLCISMESLFVSFKLKRFCVVKICGMKTWFDVSPLWSASKGMCHCLCDSIPNMRAIQLNPTQLACPNETQENLKTKKNTRVQGIYFWLFLQAFVFSFSLFKTERRGMTILFQSAMAKCNWGISPCTALLSCIDMFACIPIEQLITPFHMKQQHLENMIRQNSPEERLDCASELRGFHSVPARHIFLNAFLQHISPRDVSSRPFLRGMNLVNMILLSTQLENVGDTFLEDVFFFFYICVFYIFTEFECNEKKLGSHL